MISFLNPLFLMGLAAVAAPIVIHMMRREITVRVVFPTTPFLISSTAAVARRRQIAEYVLLALRILTVAAFALALARPRVSFWGMGSDEKGIASVAVVLDDTPSMGVRPASEAGRTRLEAAAGCLREILDRLQSGSSVRVQGAAGLILDGEIDLEEARRSLGTLAPGEEAGDLMGAVADCIEWLKGMPPPRDLYVISDFQRASWQRGRTPWAGLKVSARLVDLGRAPGDDWAVEGVRVAEDRVFRGVPFELGARVRASVGGTRAVTLELAGAEPQRRSVTLAAGETTEVRFELAAAVAGPLVGSLRIEGADDWAASDFRRVALAVLAPRSVLVLRPPEGDGHLAGEILARALSPFAGGERALAEVAQMRPPLPAEVALARFDCVALPAPSAVPEDDWPRLVRFVEDGGGLLAFADEGMTEPDFWTRAGRLLPAAGARLVEPDEPTRLVGCDYEHPVLAGFAGGENGRIADVPFRRLLALAPSEGPDGERSTLARFAGTTPAAPALVAGRYGRGRVLLFGAGPTARWGDFYREPAFVPFVHEAAAYLARSEPAVREALVGERVVVEIHPSERADDASVEERSAGQARSRPVEVDRERLLVRLGRIDRRCVAYVTMSAPGETRNTGPTRAIAVELDPGEMDHARADVAAIARDIGAADTANSRAELASVIGRLRGGREVTGALLWATFAFFVAEMLLAAHLTRRRSRFTGLGPNERGSIR